LTKNFKQHACSWWGNKKIKSSLYSLNTLSSVTSERSHLWGFAPEPTL